MLRSVGGIGEILDDLHARVAVFDDDEIAVPPSGPSGS